MTTKKATPEKEVNLEFLDITQKHARFMIVGTTPMICNAMSEKAKHQLLSPSGRKSASDRASSLKHEPFPEFQGSMYRDRNADAPARIMVRATSFKKAIMCAALDVSGVNKTQLGRLVRVEGDWVSIYGIPQLHMAVVRSADMKKTPDIRTRAIIKHWACEIEVSFSSPLIREQSVVNLLALAGNTQGIGDWRIEKGSGSFGAYRLASEGDIEFQKIVATGGTKQQDVAIASPSTYDAETDTLYEWYLEDAKKRGFKPSIAA